MEKLIIEADNGDKEQCSIIRVSNKANTLIDEIVKISGRSKVFIATKMIEFAFDYIEVKGVTDTENKEV